MPNLSPANVSIDEIKAFAFRHGLTNLSDEHLARLAEISDVVADVARHLPRVPSKSDEPAHIFRLPLK